MGFSDFAYTYASGRSSSAMEGERSAFVPPALVVHIPEEASFSSLRDHVDRAARALGYRSPTSAPRDLNAAAETMTVRVHVRPDASPSTPAGAEAVATDARGTVWRREDGWTWIFDGYRLDAPTTGTKACLSIFPDALGSGGAYLETLLAYGLREAVVTLLPRTGWLPLHAAALTGPETAQEADGVLMTGPSGCGKSTLTAGLVARGFRCVSDDLVVAELERSDASSHPPPRRVGRLTRGIRLHPDAAERLSVAGDASGHPGIAPEKSLWLPDDDQEAITCVPRLILFPQIVDAPESRLTPVSKQEALGTLLSQMSPPSLLTPPVNQAQLDGIAALLREADPFRLEAGRDLFARPGDLVDVIRQQIPESSVLS